MRSLQQFWSIRRIGEDKVTLARLGPLRLWLARADQEWGIASHYGEEDDLMDFAQVPEDVVPVDLGWRYTFFRSAPRDYIFEAMTPARPVLLSTAACIGIPVGESCTFHFAVPVGIRIWLPSDGRKQELGSVASAPQKLAWFGATVDGTFCLANEGCLTLLPPRLKTKSNEIEFTLEILNRSSGTLWPDRICLDLSRCGLFCGNTHLYGTHMQLEIRHPQDDCLVKYLGHASVPGEELLQLKQPEVLQRSEITRRILCSCHNLEPR